MLPDMRRISLAGKFLFLIAVFLSILILRYWPVEISSLGAVAATPPAFSHTTEMGTELESGVGSKTISTITPTDPRNETPSLARAVSSSLTPTVEPTVAAPVRSPSPTAALPWKAYADPIYGHRQLLHLDCEAQVAVDWAAFFGKSISELDFFHQIPSAHNPDRGFVGDANDTWGEVPPRGYGVYAGPVAQVLRAYGLAAYAYRGLSYKQLRQEVADGRPVIVWVIGHVGLARPVHMVLDGAEVLVAPYEHAVLLIGYEPQKAVVLDGPRRYSVEEIDFTNSWKILGNMAVVARPQTAPGEQGEPFAELSPF
jgi:uncharacterized protein YvpB